MSSVNKNKKYIYSFPENKSFTDLLIKGDKQRIAVTLGISCKYVDLILRGERKMPDQVKAIILRYGEINNLKNQIVPENL
jgi:hypothetical protein